MTDMAVVWLILIVLGGLALGIYELKYGLREQSWFWALWGAWGMFGAILIGIVLLGVAAFILLPPELVFAILVSVTVIIWFTLAFQAFKHKERLVGKALFVLTMLWSGALSTLLILFCGWETTDTVLTVLGLSGLALVSWGLIMKQAKAAKARKEAFYRSVLEDVDSGVKPPWET